MCVTHGKLAQVSELVLRDELLEGEVVGVPAAVLVDGEDEVLLLGDLGEFVRLLRSGRDGLLDDDVLAGEENLLRVVVVGVVDGADPDDVDVLLEGLVDRVDDADAGAVLVASLGGLGGGGAFDDDLELELVRKGLDCAEDDRKRRGRGIPGVEARVSDEA